MGKITLYIYYENFQKHKQKIFNKKKLAFNIFFFFFYKFVNPAYVMTRATKPQITPIELPAISAFALIAA